MVALIGLTLIVLVAFSPGASPWGSRDVETLTVVNIYKDYDFQGEKATLKMFSGACHNLDSNWNDQISSMTAVTNCVEVFEDFNCRGRTMVVRTPGPSTIFGENGRYSNMEDDDGRDFNNAISSMRGVVRWGVGDGILREARGGEGNDDPGC